MTLFRERLLASLLDQHAISQELVRKLLARRHPGFSAHVGEPIPASEQQRLEDTAAYLVRNPFLCGRPHSKGYADLAIMRSCVRCGTSFARWYNEIRTLVDGRWVRIIIEALSRPFGRKGASMLERVFRDGRVLDRLRGGVLGSRLDDLAAYLDERGHSSQMVEKYVRAVGHFAHWLRCKDKAPSSLSEETLRVFTEEHRTQCACSAPRGESLSHTRAAVVHWLGLLRRCGEIPPKEAAPKEPVAVALEAFETYLGETCGASPGTRRCYLQHVRFFLRARYGDGLVDLARIVPNDLVTYISDYAARVKRRTAKKAASALRTFLRSLQLQGLCGAGLVAAVPSIRSWKLSDVPKFLSEEQVRRLLTSFDRASPQGRRDYAIALLMARLGLRAGEVAGISLGDIDWRGGTLRIEGGKRRRSHVLPLPADVGRAVVAYLKQGRPQSEHRRLFLRHRPPVGEPISSAAVGGVIWRAHERGQVNAAGKGTHALRHTLATRLLRGGANLKEIADILGHRSIDTTAIYAKVDLARLTSVGLPWPEVRA